MRGDGEYVEGPSIGEALDGAVPADVLFRALRDLLAQCGKLDAEGINKTEMNRCQKHVIVGRVDGTSTLLDFRGHYFWWWGFFIFLFLARHIVQSSRSS